MKIISGKYRGRVIPTDENADYRPSTAKFKEAVFSILTSGAFADKLFLNNTKVLDIFSGTGALSFEALSRGAQSATLIDTNAQYLNNALAFAKHIGTSDFIDIIELDANFLPISQQQYNLIFMDPPYNTNYAQKLLVSLKQNNWLAANAIIAIEISKEQNLDIQEPYILLRNKFYGKNQLMLIRYEQK
jgi:16S rRNA (guanine966-N2)-methyltransferase